MQHERHSHGGRLRIFLADLFHVQQAGQNTRNSPYTVPLAIGFLASTVKRAMPEHEIQLFRDPDRFLNAVRSTPPDVVGFSFCTWNTDLTTRALHAVKATQPGTIFVGGGPSVDDCDEQLVSFFQTIGGLDYLVPNEGESGFLALVKAIANGSEGNGPIPGVCYLDSSGNLVRGKYDRPIVLDEAGLERTSPKRSRPADPDGIDIPSPYLDGTLDSFLDEGLVPIIQTMRGCPYQCTFCVSGTTEWNPMRGFDINRAKAEIDYALSRSGSDGLILTDENWGILGDRDVEIANFIAERSRSQGSPKRVYYYTAKIVTPASRKIVELMAPIAWIGEFSMSFQSMNPQTRQAIKRTNISLEKVEENVRWARERGILTSSELIYGMPFETSETFFDGFEWLSRAGIDTIQIFPLLFFPGVDLAAKEARERNGSVTRFRLPDWAYGVYDGGKIISVETEEVIYTTRWANEDDYFTVRRYGFFQQVVQGRLYLAEFSRLCADLGVPIETLMRHLTNFDYSQRPALQALLAEHRRESRAELAESRDEIYQQVVSRLKRGEEIGGLRINLVCLGKLFSSPQAVKQLLEIVYEYTMDRFADHPHKEVAVRYLTEVLPNRIVLLRPDALDVVTFSSQFDYFRWLNGVYNDPSELLLDEARWFQARTSVELAHNLAEFDANDRSILQTVFERTPSNNLLRQVSEIAVPSPVSTAVAH